MHRLLQLLQGPAPTADLSGLLLLLPAAEVPAGVPMQAAQNLPPQPVHCPADALAAPQPLQHGGLRHLA